MKSKHVLVAIGCFVLLVVAGVRIHSMRSSPASLIDSFQSSKSIEDVQTALKGRGFTWVTIEDSHLPQGDRRPPFDILTITVARYTYLGHTGELHFQFFNNRLMNTCFFPDAPASFTAALEAAIKKPIRSEASIWPFTRIRIHKDYQGRTYIAWEDTRFTKEFFSWIETHA